MPDLDLAALRALAEKAQPGPWDVDMMRNADGWTRVERAWPEAHTIGVSGDEMGHIAEVVDIYGDNAAYIAAASPDVLVALLDRLDLAEWRIAAVVAVLDELEEPGPGADLLRQALGAAR